MTEQIGILGTGRMGSALARSLGLAGYPIFLGSRERERAIGLADHLQTGAAVAMDIRPGTYSEVARQAAVVIPALGFAECRELLPMLSEELRGKIVVDISTPWEDDISPLSAAERLAALLPIGATLVGAWKSTFADLLDPSYRAGVLHDVLVVGDNEDSKQRVGALIEATGFRMVDCGDLSAAGVIEGMVRLMVPIARRLAPNGSPLNPAWKFLP